MKPGKPLQRRTPLARTGPPTRRSSKPKNTRPTTTVRPRPSTRQEIADWQEVRAAAYHRGCGACERCGRVVQLHAGDPGLPWAMHGHHRLKRSQGGGDEVANIASLCSGCHGWVHAHEEQARHAGWIVARTREPAVTAVTLHDGRTVLFTLGGGYDVVPFDGVPS